ncbi:MAG: DUF4140 domain-containing protein [Desulfuromonadales bacterium]|nr:MAG: DUF4140 domain-containing protein [Desulfuromonadales bacterium]
MRVLFAILVVLSTVLPAAAAGRSVTYYLDGARIEGEAASVKGYCEVSLPGSLVPGSFRVKPLDGASVLRVEIEPARANPKAEKESRELTERRRGLEDRLKALEVREDIFKAAAKSQSSKAPRRTKNNPEPMETIKKGTEFAVTQLEDVYRARRKAEEGLKAVDARLATLKKEGGIGGSVARIWLAGKGKAVYSYLSNSAGWTPFYDFRLDGSGKAGVTLRALLPASERIPVAVVPLRLAEAAPGDKSISVAEPLMTVARYTIDVEREEALRVPQGGVSFTVRNTSGERLVAGEGACYLQGEYLGRFRFDGCLPGEARELSVGHKVE